MADKVLKRTMFETSRVLEYFTERELSYQTGHNKSDWPLVILKELMDNALDAALMGSNTHLVSVIATSPIWREIVLSAKG